MITLEEARAAILAHTRPLPAERVHLAEALGRTLAEDITASAPAPAFDNSAMDGYALRWEDATSGDRPTLPIALHVPAGVDPAPLPPGHAARVMTGAPIPPGADTVVMREDTDEATPGQVTLLHLPRAGRGAHIRRQGEDFTAGALLLPRGTTLDPGAIGLLASLRRSVLSAVRRPRLALLSTGDELVEIDAAPAPGQLVNSSAWALRALAIEAGALPIVLPPVPDDLDATCAAFAHALSSADLIVSTGGVSVGDHDLVKAAMERLCGELTFWRVRVKPGKPLAFGISREGDKPIIGLPGNPVSSFIAFLQFVRPALRKAAGASTLLLPQLLARAALPLRSSGERLDLQRGTLSAGASPGALDFTPTPHQGSAELTSIARANAIAHVPIGVERIEAGDPVLVDLLPW